MHGSIGLPLAGSLNGGFTVWFWSFDLKCKTDKCNQSQTLASGRTCLTDRPQPPPPPVG